MNTPHSFSVPFDPSVIAALQRATANGPITLKGLTLPTLDLTLPTGLLESVGPLSLNSVGPSALRLVHPHGADVRETRAPLASRVSGDGDLSLIGPDSDDGAADAEAKGQGSSPLKPNTALSLAFLDSLDSGGRHDLCTINPYLPRTAPGYLEAATFLANQRDAMAAWIDKNQGKRNLYYTVNGATAGAPRNARLKYNAVHKSVGYIRGVGADLDAAKVEGGDPNDP